MSTKALAPEPLDMARRVVDKEEREPSSQFRISKTYRDTPASTAVILFISLVICRVPVTLGDMRSCVVC